MPPLESPNQAQEIVRLARLGIGVAGGQAGHGALQMIGRRLELARVAPQGFLPIAFRIPRGMAVLLQVFVGEVEFLGRAGGLGNVAGEPVRIRPPDPSGRETGVTLLQNSIPFAEPDVQALEDLGCGDSGIDASLIVDLEPNGQALVDLLNRTQFPERPPGLGEVFYFAGLEMSEVRLVVGIKPGHEFDVGWVFALGGSGRSIPGPGRAQRRGCPQVHCVLPGAI